MADLNELAHIYTLRKQEHGFNLALMMPVLCWMQVFHIAHHLKDCLITRLMPVQADTERI